MPVFACRINPDLIISDVMMPELDGYDLCKRLKRDQRTSHIPVIMLTARADAQDKITGFKTGADACVTKPFDQRELLLLVRNLITLRRSLRERFLRELKVSPKEITATSMDEQFLEKAIQVVESHMHDSGFQVDRFAGLMNMSRQHLNRKLRVLTSCSANDFIRTLRLKCAAQYLDKRCAA